jgi:nitrate reductase gamma subunit
MSFLETFLFGYYPYVCAVVFVVGCIARYRSEPTSWQAGSSQILSGKGFALASNLFHAGVLGLLGGHVGGLLVPLELGHHAGITNSMHQWMELIMGSICGLACWVGLTLLLTRRLSDPRVRQAARSTDLGIVILLWVTLVAGLATLPFSFQTREDAKFLVALNQWAQAVVTFHPEAAAKAAQAPLAFQVHVVLGMTVFLVVPFTRLVHACSAPLGYLLKSHRQIVRRASA